LSASFIAKEETSGSRCWRLSGTKSKVSAIAGGDVQKICLIGICWASTDCQQANARFHPIASRFDTRRLFTR
jgi:hypothetical protein